MLQSCKKMLENKCEKCTNNLANFALVSFKWMSDKFNDKLVLVLLIFLVNLEDIEILNLNS